MENPMLHPGQLSKQFVKLLYETYGKHTGYFQIVQFHPKKKKYYSTHIADGFYKCKVIFRDKASKQIDDGQIKLFSVLYGTITNQGQRVLMAFESLQVWQYPRIIGVLRSWKNQINDIYMNGSNFINWNDQYIFDNDGSQQDLVLPTTTLTVSQTIDLTTDHFHDPERNVTEKSNLIQISSNPILPTVYSFGSNQVLSSSPKKQKAKEKQSIKQTDFDKAEICKQEKSNKKLKLLLVSQTSSQQESSDKKQNEKPSNNFLKIKEQLSEAVIISNNKIMSNRLSKQQPKEIFVIEDNNFERKYQNENQNSHINDDDDIFSEMMSQASKLKQGRTNLLVEQSIQSIMKEVSSTKCQRTTFANIFECQNVKCIKIPQTSSNQILKGNCKSEYSNPEYNSPQIKKKSMLQFLFESDKTSSDTKNNYGNNLFDLNRVIDLEQTNNSQKKIQIVDNNIFNGKCKINDGNSTDHQMRVKQLSTITLGRSNVSKSWMKVMILCQKYINDGSGTKILQVVEQVFADDCGQIFNMLLTNAETCNPFQIGEIYQIFLTNIKINQPDIEQFNVNVELRADAQKIMALKVEELKFQDKKKQHHPSFLNIQKVEKIKEGVSVNIVGVVFRLKNIACKKKGLSWMNIFTIADPFNGATVDFSIFDTQKIVCQPGVPILIFNSIVRLYQNKKTLAFGNYTFYYFDREITYGQFAHLIPQLNKIRKWEEEGYSINNVIVKNSSFYLLSSLLQAEEIVKGQQFNIQSLNVETPLCRVVKMSPFFSQLICDSCNKKLSGKNAYCFSCGRRNNPLKQFHLSFLVSDGSHSFFVQFNHYDSIALIGEDGSRIAQFTSQILHSWVKLWISLNPKYKATVIKMEIVQPSEIVHHQLEKLRELTKFI